MHTEAPSDAKIQLIKESLFDFVSTHVPNADLDAIDDVIVSYVFSAIDAADSSPEDFCVHVNDLVEIMSAYVADFNKIARDAVYIWLMDVMSTLTEDEQKPYMDEAGKPDAPKKDSFSFYIPKESSSKSSSASSSRSNSTSEDDLKFPVSTVRKMPTRKQIQDFETAVEESKKHAASLPASAGPYHYPVLVKFLTEMFPDVSPIEVKHCVTIALGDVEGALATLMHRIEHGLVVSPGPLPARARPAPADSASVRSRIIERYSYVDRESESKEHKPLAPKHAPKKMVRYRDNKIVSLKGERYTEVSKGDEEGVKKSNKKHHP